MGGVAETVRQSADLARDYLASERGRRARATLAAGMITAAPFVMRLPVVRRHPLGRVLALAGGAAAVVKAAELIRDWEPHPASR